MRSKSVRSPHDHGTDADVYLYGDRIPCLIETAGLVCAAAEIFKTVGDRKCSDSAVDDQSRAYRCRDVQFDLTNTALNRRLYAFNVIRECDLRYADSAGKYQLRYLDSRQIQNRVPDASLQ